MIWYEIGGAHWFMRSEKEKIARFYCESHSRTTFGQQVVVTFRPNKTTSHINCSMTSVSSKKKATAFAEIWDSSRLCKGWHRWASRRVSKSFDVGKARIATLNVITLSGCPCELAAELEGRRVELYAIQETRWWEGKSKDDCNSFKLAQRLKTVLSSSSPNAFWTQ